MQQRLGVTLGVVRVESYERFCGGRDVFRKVNNDVFGSVIVTPLLHDR